MWPNPTGRQQPRESPTCRNAESWGPSSGPMAQDPVRQMGAWAHNIYFFKSDLNMQYLSSFLGGMGNKPAISNRSWLMGFKKAEIPIVTYFYKRLRSDKTAAAVNNLHRIYAYKHALPPLPKLVSSQCYSTSGYKAGALVSSGSSVCVIVHF